MGRALSLPLFRVMEYTFNELHRLIRDQNLKIESLLKKIEALQRNKKRNHVYLAGSISRDIRTYQWREEFERLMGDDPNFVIVNPCKNKFNQSLRDYDGDNTEFIKEAVARSQNVLKPKDRKLIEMCNAIVVNLEIYVNSKQPLATFFEICWAEDLMIPVIGIMGNARNWTPPTYEERIEIAKEYVRTGSVDHIPMENIYVKHSWVNDAVSAWVKTVPDAVSFIKEFFGEY
jgi:nucleoside 2-deoxyribosyltransferase